MTRKEAEENRWLHWIGDEVDEAYLKAVTSMSLQPEGNRQISHRLGIVYTPFTEAEIFPSGKFCTGSVLNGSML